MKIKGCCISFLHSWDSMAVQPAESLILRCKTCKQRWQLKKREKQDSGNYQLIDWIKLKKPKEALDE